MKPWQRIIKHLAFALAIVLAVSIIIGIVEVFGMILGFGNNQKLLDKSVEIAISQDISSVKIDVGAAELKVLEGDSFTLYSNIKELSINESDGTLSIKHNSKKVSIHSNKVGEITLTIPKNHKFDRFEVQSGAGTIEIASLSANIVDFEFGAGNVDVGYLLATQKVRIEAGAGELNVASGELNCLDLDLGVGKTTVSAQIIGNSEINCGVGSTYLTLLGSADDYRIDVDTGIGALRVNGNRISGSAVIGNGKSYLNIDGGIGEVEIDFANE